METAALLLAVVLLCALVAEGILRMHERSAERRHLAELERLCAHRPGPSVQNNPDTGGRDAA